MAVERSRPMKLFRATIAFGPYSKGATLQPTGIYRDMLLRRGWIVEVVDPQPQTKMVAPDPMPPLDDRLVRPRRNLASRSAAKDDPLE